MLETFSSPGDVVLDPYMGGGTTIVEAMAAGREAIGCDLNSLAVFVARAKTQPISTRDAVEIRTWASTVIPGLNYRIKSDRIAEAICADRARNMHLPSARPLKKFLALALLSLEELSSEEARLFARCVLLNVSQWALNGKKTSVSLASFRERVTQCAQEMLKASISFQAAVEEQHGGRYLPRLIHDSAANLQFHSPFKSGRKADLVVTSPPYPGVHMLYHRWQVDGRRETPAPYWIADCLDGKGEAFYTFGSRKDPDSEQYFSQSLATLRAIRSVMKKGAVMAQMIAFSRPETQLKRYLRNMDEAGFEELRRPTGRAIRSWRSVPGRSWHANLKGHTHSAREVALLHRAV
ncbi:hypothetical protein GCM10023332_02570 [Luteimonas vadosa]|uniref:Methyltransferase n=1 Tax=Luteimonas vadosa TaxID=1165507 RepID=A0ABP9DSG7_9GAMM